MHTLDDKNRLKRRNRAFLWALIMFVVLFYGLAIVRIGGH